MLNSLGLRYFFKGTASCKEKIVENSLIQTFVQFFLSLKLLEKLVTMFSGHFLIALMRFEHLLRVSVCKTWTSF